MTTQTKTKTTSVDPSLLAPDFDNLPGELIAEEYTFWLGVTSDCPRGQIDVAGLHFSKSEEEIVINDAGKQVRVPKHGTLNMTVTKHHFEELLKVLPRLVIRPSKAVTQDGSGENTGDPVQRAKGKLIKIPDDKMIAGVAESGRRLKPYVRRPGDRPATEFMYFMHAPEGVRGLNYQTIAEAGLEWPAVIQEVDDLMS
jgi:hypothetical protein